MRSDEMITRTNVMEILKRFAREYRKTLGKAPGEIIIAGGGSIMLNYSFRDATQDLDVIIHAASGIKDVITRFADENHLPGNWMNTDFMKTSSYSDALTEVSRHYCWLNNQTLEIRTISGVYLIAMKIAAHRNYRNDISDVIGILTEEAESGNTISYDEIESAFQKLYGRSPDPEMREQISGLCGKNTEELRAFYNVQRKAEHSVAGRLVSYMENAVPVNTRNVEDITARIRKKMISSGDTSRERL